MFLHNLSQWHVSALSWAIFRLNTFVCEVNHTVNNVMLLLSARHHVTYIKFIQLKFITAIVELKCSYNIKYIKKTGYRSHGRGVGMPESGIILFNCVGFFLPHWLFCSGLIIGSCKTLCWCWSPGVCVLDVGSWHTYISLFSSAAQH